MTDAKINHKILPQIEHHLQSFDHSYLYRLSRLNYLTSQLHGWHSELFFAKPGKLSY